MSLTSLPSACQPRAHLSTQYQSWQEPRNSLEGRTTHLFGQVRRAQEQSSLPNPAGAPVLRGPQTTEARPAFYYGWICAGHTPVPRGADQVSPLCSDSCGFQALSPPGFLHHHHNGSHWLSTCYAQTLHWALYRAVSYMATSSSANDTRTLESRSHHPIWLCLAVTSCCEAEKVQITH